MKNLDDRTSSDRCETSDLLRRTDLDPAELAQVHSILERFTEELFTGFARVEQRVSGVRYLR